MKRRIAKLCTLLLLGAIVNVAVAWTLILIPIPATSSTPIESNVCESLWKRFAKIEWPECPSNSITRQGGGASAKAQVSVQTKSLGLISEIAQVTEGPTVGATNTKMWLVNRNTCGLPMSALHGENSFTNVPTNVSERHGAFRLSKYRRLIPYMPLWPGFAINTVFYAAVLWVLFAGPGKVRRIIREHRGLCPACAYPVGSNDVCTECGSPVNSRPS